ncbi:MAG: hypothetical protein WAU39_15490 [Polyangiales bacterium]
MGKILFLSTLAVMLTACGDSSAGPRARSVAQVCDEMCGWPDECFVQLGVPVQGAECVQSCEAQADLVGVDCISAISDTIACLGTCDVESVTQEQALACQDEAQAISDACQ